MSEKHPNLAPPPRRPESSHLKRTLLLTVLASSALGGLLLLWQSHTAQARLSTELMLRGQCPPQVAPLSVSPEKEWDPASDDAYVQKSAERLSKAVQFPTVSQDVMPIDVNPDDAVWKPLADLGNYLDETFPLVHGRLTLEKINHFGRLYTWQGKDKHLKPIVLMAHMDVVPVPNATISRWTYPPFSGTIDKDGWIWGRGSADCKNTLMAVLGAVEKLLESEHQPERTVLLSFGFDEEIGGPRGARPLAEAIEARYGKNGVAFLVDEGFSGVDDSFGAKVASLGIAEKGAMNVELEVDTLGGHSSVPPVHTSIGVLSMIIAELEAHPFPARLEASSPYLQFLQCSAEFGKDMPKHVKKALRDPRQWDRLSEELSQDRTIRAWLGTTQAADLFSGGIKVNALPEVATATINHRINFLSSVNESLKHVLSIVEPIALKLNFTLDLHGSHKDVEVNVIRLGVTGALEPAPLTPTSGPVWDLVAGTTRRVFEDSIVSPSAMIANTDTKWSWSLTNSIYRFVPASLSLIKNFHTVNEGLAIEAHLTTTQWFHALIINLDGWRE